MAGLATRGVLELVGSVEPFVLDNDRNIARPRGQSERSFFRIVDDHHSRHASVDLIARSHIRVRVEPISARAIDDFESMGMKFAGRENVLRMSISEFGNVHAVEVNHCVFGQAVQVVDLNVLARFKPNNGANAAAEILDSSARTHAKRTGVSIGVREVSRQDGQARRLADQTQMNVVLVTKNLGQAASG